MAENGVGNYWFIQPNVIADYRHKMNIRTNFAKSGDFRVIWYFLLLLLLLLLLATVAVMERQNDISM